jgi:uncharacterized membrane protein (UPF0127 family)
MKKYVWSVLCAIALVSCGGKTITADLQEVFLTSERGDRLHLQVEVARTQAEQERGLSTRKRLAGDGMLFAFSQPQILHFWMHETLIPLDIAFFDVTGKLVSTSTMDPCTKDPCPTFSSTAQASYALEVAQGYLRRHGIGDGWRIHWEQE